MLGKPTTALFAGAVALAGSLAPAAAYTVNDVCSVEIGVLYTLGGGNYYGKKQTFTLTNQQPDGFLQINAGTFTLTVDGKLCDNHPDHPDNGGSVTNAFMGITSHTVLENDFSQSAISVICLDQEVAEAADESVDMAPIIISIAIDSSVLLVGETATISVGAIDPNKDEVPGNYVFAMDDTGSTVGSAAGSCSTGSCAATYTASSGEFGNQPFSFTVRDDGWGVDGNTLADTVTGSVIVDDSGAIQFGIENYHRPSSLSVIVDNEQLTFGQSATITISAHDEDLNSGLVSDVLKLVDPAFQQNYMSDSTTWVYPSNTGGIAQEAIILKQVFGNVDITNDGVDTVSDDLACNIGDLSVGTPTTVGDETTWVVTWNPWNSALGTVDSYGLVSCAFNFQAFDSKNLLSDSVQVTLSATATAQDPSFTDIPYFESIMIDDISPALSDTVEVRVFYSDTSGGNQVDFSLSLPGLPNPMISSITRCDIDGTTDQATNCDAPSSWSGSPFTFSDTDCTPTGSGATYESGCSHILQITVSATAVTGVSQPENVISLSVTDAVSGYSDLRTLDQWNIGGSRRAKRSEGATVGPAAGLQVSFAIEGGLLVGSLAESGGELGVEDAGSPSGGDGVIVAVAVGCVAAVAAVAAAVVAVRRRRAAAAGTNIDLGTTWDNEGGATTVV